MTLPELTGDDQETRLKTVGRQEQNDVRSRSKRAEASGRPSLQWCFETGRPDVRVPDAVDARRGDSERDACVPPLAVSVSHDDGRAASSEHHIQTERYIGISAYFLPPKGLKFVMMNCVIAATIRLCSHGILQWTIQEPEPSQTLSVIS